MARIMFEENLQLTYPFRLLPQVSRETLRVSPITNMLLENPNHVPGDSYFLDRDPDLFEQVLLCKNMYS